jgi:Ankyrin repeats (many copies)
MALELNKRTKIMAGVGALLVAGAGAWFFFLQDFLSEPAPAPKTAVTKPAKPAAEAAKAGDATKAAGAPTAAKASATPAVAKPIPSNPDKLIAEVIDTSGIKTQFQVISREILFKSIWGEQTKREAGDVRAVSDMVDKSFEPAVLGAELAASLKGNFDAERMARFLEVLRQPVAVKLASPALRNVAPETMQETTEKFRANPPSAARVKLIQSLDDVTRTSETATDLSAAIVGNIVDSVLGDMKKAGKSVPKDAREQVAAQVNEMRNQMRGQVRSTLLVAYRDATDQELADYVKLLDTDTGRWGMELLSNAARPILASRGALLGKEAAPLATAKRAGAAAKAPAEPAPEPLAKAQVAAPAAKPAEAVAAPAAPVGYQRAANVRELYVRYNDVVSATVMRDQAAVAQLLDDGKSPNARQSDGMTVLMIATSNGDASIANLLLAKGADPNLRGRGGLTALSIAKARGSAGAEMVQLLQRSGAKD